MLKPIPLEEGLYLNVDAEELQDPKFATVLKNFIINEAGSNLDRPALLQVATLGAIIVVGATFFGGYCVFVTNDRRIWKMDSAHVVTEITGAAVLGGTDRPSFADDGTFLAIAGGAAPQVWDGLGLCTLMPGNPPNTRTIVYLDGYWLAAETDTQTIQYAGPTAATRLVWGGGDFFSAEGYQDNVSKLGVLFRELWALGDRSIECFQNTGQSTPFGRTFSFDRGIAARASLIQADNTFWFLDSERRFVHMNGKTPEIISEAIDRTVKNLTTISDCWGFRLDIDGYYLLVWCFPTEQKTFVFDYKKKKWFQWSTWHDSKEVHLAINAIAFADPSLSVPAGTPAGWNKYYAGGTYSGVVSHLSRAYKTDNGDILRRVRRTGMINHGSDKRKVSRGYHFNVKRGLGTPGGVEPLFEFRFNDDNGGWTDYIQVGLGFPGDPNTAIWFPVGGIYRKRELELVFSDAVEAMIIGISEDITELLS